MQFKHIEWYLGHTTTAGNFRPQQTTSVEGDYRLGVGAWGILLPLLVYMCCLLTRPPPCPM